MFPPRVVVILLLLVAAAVLAIAIVNNSRPVAVVYGRPVVEDDLGVGLDRLTAFSEIVQRELTSNLVNRFGVDTSEEAIKEHAMQLGYDIVAPDRIRHDQSLVADIAQALEDVVEERRTGTEAFAHYSLDSQMREEDWEQLLKVNGNREAIVTYWTFASQTIPNAQADAITNFRQIYLSQTIESEVCNMEPNSSLIKSILRRKLGDAAEAIVESVWNHECRLVAMSFLSDELKANVVVNDTSLAGFDDHISFATMQEIRSE